MRRYLLTVACVTAKTVHEEVHGVQVELVQKPKRTVFRNTMRR
jgi:hypothetical protein